jgi:hypothetical protein
MRKHPNSHREAKATAPFLDSTRGITHQPGVKELFFVPICEYACFVNSKEKYFKNQVRRRGCSRGRFPSGYHLCRCGIRGARGTASGSYPPELIFRVAEPRWLALFHVPLQKLEKLSREVTRIAQAHLRHYLLDGQKRGME